MDQAARENWQRYEYAIERGHYDYCVQASRNERFYLGGQYDEELKQMVGGQWDDDDLSYLAAARRPAYEFNEILPGVNAAIGYQIQNRADIAFRPRGGAADQMLADLHSKVVKQIGDQNKLPWLETQVFADGLIQQRGYFDIRMDWSRNMLGDVRITTLDPLDVLPDPDAKAYDPDGWEDVTIARWIPLAIVEMLWGKEARDRLQNLNVENDDFGETDRAQVPRNKFGVTRRRSVGGYLSFMRDGKDNPRVRVLDRQYWRHVMSRVAIYPTGELKILPDAAQTADLRKHEADGAYIDKRMMRRPYWCVTAASSVVLQEEASPYAHFTVVPYFPYFRRGVTRGMVDNAIGPQQAHNKALSQAIHIVNSTANSGWLIEKDSLTNIDTDDLETAGGKTGLILEYAKGSSPPGKIPANSIPTGMMEIAQLMRQMARDSTTPDAMRGISGQQQSGLAVQSLQFGSQQQLAIVLDNLARTRNLLAGRVHTLVQTYVDTNRIFRITETNPVSGKPEATSIAVNIPKPGGGYLNDLTIGDYDVVITEQPMQVTFENSQFQQAMDMRRQGVGLPDWAVVKHSNLTDKQELLEEMRQPQQASPVAEAEAALIQARTEKERGLAHKSHVEASNRVVEAQFGAIQTAQTIAAIPQTAAIADALMRSAGVPDMDGPPAATATAPESAATEFGPAIEGRPPRISPEQQAAINAAGERLPLDDNTNPLTPRNPGRGLLRGLKS